MRCDEAALGGGRHLRRAHAEDLGAPNPPTGRPHVVTRGRVRRRRPAGCRRRPRPSAGPRPGRASRRCAWPSWRRRRKRATCSAASSGSIVRSSRRISAQAGVPPAQCTACALAAKVKLGMTTGPRASWACRTSISPAVQLDTATTCGTSRSSAARSSSSATVRPLVSIPLSRIDPIRRGEARDVGDGRDARVAGRRGTPSARRGSAGSWSVGGHAGDLVDEGGGLPLSRPRKRSRRDRGRASSTSTNGKTCTRCRVRMPKLAKLEKATTNSSVYVRQNRRRAGCGGGAAGRAAGRGRATPGRAGRALQRGDQGLQIARLPGERAEEHRHERRREGRAD